MTIKKSLIIILLATLSLLFSNESNFVIELNNLVPKEEYSNTDFLLSYKHSAIKKVYIKEFNIPENLEKNIIYLNVEKHRGYSTVFFNDIYMGSIGSIYNIKESNITAISIVRLFVEPGMKGQLNTLKIVNYSQKRIPEANYIINTYGKTFLQKFYQKIMNSFPIGGFVIVSFILLIYLNSRKREFNRNGFFIVSLSLFLIYLFLSVIQKDGLLKDKLEHISYPLLIFGWITFLLYHLIKFNNWHTKKVFYSILFILVTIFCFSILSNFNIFEIDEDLNSVIIIMAVNIIFLIKTIRINDKIFNSFKVGLVVSLTLYLIKLGLFIFNKPDYGVPITSLIICLTTYGMVSYRHLLRSIDRNSTYTKKLLDTLENNKEELNKKDSIISELKNNNDEILREKSLFFSSLGRNLRAPLNSIIGYSENLYATTNINEVNPIVTEIIIESDKIFQAINNVMDFSSRDFSNNDLQLKDFRMKEIFDNSVYSSEIIKNFKSNITYRAVGVCDKVLISGNPAIYKQMITNILHYLIGLGPEHVSYTLFDSGITETSMNLEAKFIAKRLGKSEETKIAPLSDDKSVFTKYIKLYNIYFNEEYNDDNYIIDLKFECGLATPNKPNPHIPVATDLDKVLSVLIVDDYQPNLNIVKLHLDKMGCVVYTATNGEEALTIFREEYIDVILMDIQMPIMDGWEATEKIRSTEKGIETLIVGLTASSLDLDIRHCYESGMDDVLVKPIRKNQLFKKLQSVDNYKAIEFPTIAMLRADCGISKFETETLFKTVVKQISRQLEVLEMLSSAHDSKGMEKEIPVIIHAALTINAFYYSRILRNFYDAYKKKDIGRMSQLYSRLATIIEKVQRENSDLFRN